MSAPYAYYEDINLGLLRLWGDRKNAAILDVGCGYATTSERLQKAGNHVTGIESSEGAVAVAQRRLERVIAADLMDLERVGSEIKSQRYDAIIFADVLEHLPWPQETLKRYIEFLKPGGSIIVSLPNVGLWSVRLSVLAGRFDYADTGVLDRTHLRFFTRRTARAMIEGAGLAIARTTYNPGIVRPFVPLVKKVMASKEGADPSAILESRPYKLYLKTFYPFERVAASVWPGALAFQMIFEAKPR